ncbi:HAMP domain-containing histidine kinase [Clostridium estertheticum]|uniref:sensor histidine kinase n=2 Tax=Clostridium estertheticum TaxID=238834 RepID=UPI001CF102AA|nr:HAMP domain-containing sensor histidine kinase [Clostridium estertheticum]MCB2306214.1 HAMP domain-containing histidine kinase [Clostridium estertheticum]MCB2349306.1 HAMP domain-containing histidine kinase [Clostridium estertheticum]WAG45050.1 HAMP domain-containing histidine kinase [Clostridium estertheticum]
MKTNYNLKMLIYKTSIILFCFLFNTTIYFKTLNIQITIITAIFSLGIISFIFLYDILFKNYMTSILEELSDMLETISHMESEEVFLTTEDTIFSKLQSQTTKLTNLLISQNKEIEEEKNEIKSLISDIAHQLKTPLSNIKIYSEFLQDDNLKENERKEFNNIVLFSLNKLTFLVESMIKMSRLESGVIGLKLEKDSLNETVLLALCEVQKKAKNKNILIGLNEVDKIIINHDKNWLSEAIFNILENGVKYTKNGGEIDITIKTYEVFCRVDIEDNGVGISEDEFPKIFSRFYRGRNIGDAEGIGIGLYLSREIIMQHGGYIKVNSNNGGSKFSIFLPK